MNRKVEVQVRITVDGVPQDFYVIKKDHAVENTSCVLRYLGKDFEEWLRAYDRKFKPLIGEIE